MVAEESVTGKYRAEVLSIGVRRRAVNRSILELAEELLGVCTTVGAYQYIGFYLLFPGRMLSK
jgi:hypothetical protein